MSTDLISLAVRIGRILEELGVPYALGGSLASSIHGEPRSSQDVDLVADLRAENATSLVAACTGEFVVDENMVQDAIRCRGSFNLIHLPSALKVDIYVAKDRALAAEELRRRESKVLGPEGSAYVLSPEDIVLEKLEWYQATDETSDRQWRDILGVLKVQHTNLDIEYLRHWAEAIGVTDLLERSLCEAGLAESEG